MLYVIDKTKLGDFTVAYWRRLSPVGQLAICKHPQLSSKFIEACWPYLPEEQRNVVMKKTSTIFLHEHWEELTTQQKLMALDFGFFSKLPCKLLPKYQTSKIVKVRRYAESRFDEYMQKQATATLPNYLTDTDPTIRKMVKELISKSRTVRR